MCNSESEKWWTLVLNDYAKASGLSSSMVTTGTVSTYATTQECATGATRSNILSSLLPAMARHQQQQPGLSFTAAASNLTERFVGLEEKLFGGQLLAQPSSRISSNIHFATDGGLAKVTLERDSSLVLKLSGYMRNQVCNLQENQWWRYSLWRGTICVPQDSRVARMYEELIMELLNMTANHESCKVEQKAESKNHNRF